jgi:hypothetical protein
MLKPVQHDGGVFAKGKELLLRLGFRMTVELLAKKKSCRFSMTGGVVGEEKELSVQHNGLIIAAMLYALSS